jgi:hypothetical protein
VETVTGQHAVAAQLGELLGCALGNGSGPTQPSARLMISRVPRDHDDESRPDGVPSVSVPVAVVATGAVHVREASFGRPFAGIRHRVSIERGTTSSAGVRK